MNTRIYFLTIFLFFFNFQQSVGQLPKKITTPDKNSKGITQPVASTPAGYCAPLIKGFTPQSAGYGDTVTIELMIPCSVNSVYFGDEPALSFTSEIYSPLLKAVVGKGNSGYISIHNAGWGDTKAGFNYLPVVNSVVPVSLCPDESIVINAGITGSSFHWEVSLDDTTFNVVNNDANHGGATTTDLNLINSPSSWTGRKYRCVSNQFTSNIYKLVFANWRRINTQGNWENPAAWSCGVLPDSNTDVVISTNVTLSSNATVHSIKIIPGGNLLVATGYQLTISE